MGESVEKASGQTFNQISTHIPDTCSISLSVTSSHTLNMSNRSPSEALKSGLPMSVFATGGLFPPWEGQNDLPNGRFRRPHDHSFAIQDLNQNRQMTDLVS